MTRFAGAMQRRKALKDSPENCLINRFMKTGSVHIEKPKQYKKPVTNDQENVEKVRELISRNVGMSLNQMSIELNLSKSSVWRILWKSLNFYPYRINLTTELTD